MNINEIKVHEFSGADIKLGDEFTIEGCGFSKKGHLVIGGRSAKTNRKMKAEVPIVYVVQKILKGSDE